MIAKVISELLSPFPETVPWSISTGRHAWCVNHRFSVTVLFVPTHPRFMYLSVVTAV